MRDIAAQDLAGKLLSEGFTSNAPLVGTLTDPIAETQVIATLDELAPYELDPRLTRNPRYDEIKESIRERGLDAPLVITRRPGGKHYIIRNGGNTRLAILRELWTETKDERCFRIPCLFRPWSERGEIVALTGHLAENELHGGLSFIERALGVQQARELYEQETGKQLSQSELARRLKGDGYPVPQPHISRMQEAIQYLLPAIPTVLYAGLGRHQVEQLTSLRRAAERVWAARSTETGQSLDFPTLFQDVLTLFDSTAGNFSVQRVQDELIGQMVDLLHIEYDTLAFEITDSDRRWQVLSAEPTSTPESSATAPMPKQLPPPAPEAAPEPVPATPETSPEPSSPRASTSSGQTVQHTQEEPQAGEDHRAAMLQEHIVSPAGTTERLQSIQRLVADHTGEALPDFESNVLQSIPVQAGGLFPITDLWYIEPTLDDPERLRMHIAQFAREIASEAGIQEFIESCENGTGFLCQLHDVSAVADPRSRAILALLYVLSAPYLPAGLVTNGIDASILTENLGILLQGSPTATGSKDSKPQRLSDTSLVKLFRLIRLTRHLWDFEADSPNGGSAMTGS
ncbi:ParB family protein [Pseudomonas aeruginosa]|uniref:ParB family protein n=1 Tax=Pseudomonas aeruginosa TaxID=287 RepID=UPI00053E7503|nr:ParB family protein [Pseudomonas aeruginosa]WCV81063.1 ParB family protein [Pseudomonas aeruginosa]HBO0859788.1 ParB family protein [Pseudomonas aeruginosa]HCE6879340.1 ParB family protein [Pseudomonas aeruginosa]HDR2971927.1 ParB family protein [Pseudomonas aeruginosa]